MAWGIIQEQHSKAEIVKRLLILIMLCAPFNINGNVFTVLGNASSSRNIVSVLSFYQTATKTACTIFGIGGYQNAGEHATTIIGIGGYQKAGKDAGIGFGFGLYQEAGKNAEIFVGVSGYQKALYACHAMIGFAFYQNAREKTRTFGAFTKFTYQDEIDAKT